MKIPSFKTFLVLSAAVVMLSLAGGFAYLVLSALRNEPRCKGSVPVIPPETCTAAREVETFSDYPWVAEGIRVSVASMFKRNQAAESTRTNSAGDEVTSELGTIYFAPGFPMVVQETVNPMERIVDLLDRPSGKMFGRFKNGTLVFSGKDVVYHEVDAFPLCKGQVTKKYVMQGDKLEEVPQALYSVNEATKLVEAVSLYADPDKKVSIVATLGKGSEVRVIGLRDPDTLLLRTAQGLSGWLSLRDSGVSPLEITMCN